MNVFLCSGLQFIVSELEYSENKYKELFLSAWLNLYIRALPVPNLSVVFPHNSLLYIYILRSWYNVHAFRNLHDSEAWRHRAYFGFISSENLSLIEEVSIHA